ncbi:autotransporter domain-containing protein [Bradyrhizobium diazoefficiens]|nr:autotransporter domain-containing protein [Bradyrhizobium diazoefficiens]
MKRLTIALAAAAAFSGSATAADLGARPLKAVALPVTTANWTGFYVFGGVGGGLWSADSNVLSSGPPAVAPAGTPFTRDQRLGGSGWFGTVGAGYDWQFNGGWVAGVFADGQFGNISGTIADPFSDFSPTGREKLHTSYAAGARLGHLVAPNVLSYVNAGYSGSDWSGSTLSVSTIGGFFPVGTPLLTTPSFHRDGWFIGGGVENSLNIFGISAPGWFMKTEYRSAYYTRTTLPETFAATGTPAVATVTFKPWVQTISSSLVYRFNAAGTVAAAESAPRLYTKAQAAGTAPSWTGFYAFGGGGGGLWNADSNVVASPALAAFGFAPGTPFTSDQRMGGTGWFGTVGAGYDRQFNSNWVAGLFADGQFGDIRGSLANPTMPDTEGTEKLRTSYAAGVRLGYLVAPNVLSYVNAGYSGSEWSGTTQATITLPSIAFATTPSFRRDGWFVGGGVENSLNIFGISAPGWFMKTEYRSAFYDRITLPQTVLPAGGGGDPGTAITFKPWVQTISTAIVYRFN